MPKHTIRTLYGEGTAASQKAAHRFKITMLEACIDEINPLNWCLERRYQLNPLQVPAFACNFQRSARRKRVAKLTNLLFCHIHVVFAIFMRIWRNSVPFTRPSANAGCNGGVTRAAG